jgi:hypothetical protein
MNFVKEFTIINFIEVAFIVGASTKVAFIMAASIEEDNFTIMALK